MLVLNQDVNYLLVTGCSLTDMNDYHCWLISDACSRLLIFCDRVVAWPHGILILTSILQNSNDIFG